MKVQKETPTLVCSCEIYEIFKNTYFEEQQEAVSVYSSSCFLNPDFLPNDCFQVTGHTMTPVALEIQIFIMCKFVRN